MTGIETGESVQANCRICGGETIHKVILLEPDPDGGWIRCQECGAEVLVDLTKYTD